MLDLSKYKSFEWDKGNFDKSYHKHGISPNESEEIFLDEELKILKDIRHSQKEERFIALGTVFSGKKLFVVFTLRGEKIRIISVRPMNKKERENYEKT
ncbi:MAG: BrnT family toxin [Patescibacteria group bacterium]|nr:BrnT family toxin [Patescibacteria group bacterium]